MAAAVLAGLAGTAVAQVESHCLPPEMPMALFPSWVSQLPPVESREISPPLLHERNETTQADEDDVRRLLGLKANGDGKPDATTLDEMCREPRQTVRLAQSGRYRDAAAAGDPLLNLPRERYGDFTWDYLTNATAWAHAQNGDLKSAVQAHNAGAARLADTAVAQYHRLAATVLNETVKSPRQMKEYETFQKELRERLVDRVKGFNQSAELARKTRSAAARLRHLEDAYGHLRVLTASDRDLGNRLARTTFREATDGLVRDIAPVLLDEARRYQLRLVTVSSQMLPGRRFGDWNTDVHNLWDRIRHVKRLCRMHDYLRRVDLAGNGDSARLFREAHRLLFVPDNPGLVWQEIGLRRVFYKDFRLRSPYEQTKIKPM